MKNKKTLALITYLFFPIINSYASDGSVKYFGNIIDATCTIDTASSNLDPDLGSVGVNALNGAAGTTASQTRFDISLSNCPASINEVAIRFDGVTDQINPSILKLNGTLPIADGVGVALYEQNGVTQIPVSMQSDTKPISANGDATLTFYAKYMSTKSVVTGGSGNATSDFTISYY